MTGIISVALRTMHSHYMSTPTYKHSYELPDLVLIYGDNLNVHLSTTSCARIVVPIHTIFY